MNTNTRKAIKLPLNIIDIQRCIPHRYPFLLLDRIIDINLEDTLQITALKNISSSDLILQGHFPDNPVYPGVLMLEGMAQAAGCLARYAIGENYTKQNLLTEIKSARFRKPVIPGDVLRYEITCTKQRAPFYWFNAAAKVDNSIVASATLSALVR